MDKFILKKRSIWFHIIVGYFTLGIWVILFLYYKHKNSTNNIKPEIISNNNIVNDTKVSIVPNTSKTLSLYKESKCLLLFDNYVVFDIETTGFDSFNDKIIEIGCLKYKNGELIDTFNQLINPGIPIPSKITKITGISDSTLVGADTIDVVLPKFLKFIEDYPLVAHNSSFDLGFIEANLNYLNIPIIKNKTVDTLTLARRFLPGLENHKLETLKEHFNVDVNSHRATDDCYTTNAVYSFCREIANHKGKLDVLSTSNKQISLNNQELEFISLLQDKLKELNDGLYFTFDFMSSDIINFKLLGNYQIGRVKLRGTKYKMQLLSRNDVKWIDCTYDDALSNINHFIQYTQELMNGDYPIAI